MDMGRFCGPDLKTFSFFNGLFADDLPRLEHNENQWDLCSNVSDSFGLELFSQKKSACEAVKTHKTYSDSCGYSDLSAGELHRI